ncbi:hypothetical protein YC2023_060941 [Brassica napus]
MDCNDRITGSLGIHNEMPGNDMVSKVHVRCSSKGLCEVWSKPLGQVLIQRRRDHDRDLQAQAEPLGGGSFHGVSWRGRDLHTKEQRESMMEQMTICGNIMK